MPPNLILNVMNPVHIHFKSIFPFTTRSSKVCPPCRHIYVIKFIIYKDKTCKANLTVSEYDKTYTRTRLPTTFYADTEGKWRYSSNPLETSTLKGVGRSTPRPGTLYPRKRPGTNCTGGWVWPRAGLDGYGETRASRDSISATSSP
jgi:hypothetical protein